MITNPIGVAALMRREIYRFMSVAGQTILPPVVNSLLFMFIFGVAVGQRITFHGTGLTYLEFIVPGLMVMHLISGSYENTSSSLFIARWHNHIQEVLLAPLSYFEMVLGLLAGGVVRGVIVCIEVFIVSVFFLHTEIYHPLLFLYFIVTISVIFACAGMMGALWAEDFSMLSTWNVYIIVPLVLLGGVFHPVSGLPVIAQKISHFNPLFYLVSGVRYSVTGMIDVSLLICITIAFVLSIGFFFLTVLLFKMGYKLRT
ncbi:MAG: ABC transporter permease [Candidatus Omnitrophica bacterium]|nr:ABC transporter permease [Candidatus Omnitrophota bacterium]